MLPVLGHDGTGHARRIDSVPRSAQMISVIVPHLNQPEPLQRCLASLACQVGLAEQAEIIVVDNGSTVSPSDICAAFPNVNLMFQPIPGPGPARNLGASH